jgi:putative transposase
MTNHFHLLAVSKREDSLSRGVGITNLLYTQYLNRTLGNTGRVWQNRFFSFLGLVNEVPTAE